MLIWTQLVIDFQYPTWPRWMWDTEALQVFVFYSHRNMAGHYAITNITIILQMIDFED